MFSRRAGKDPTCATWSSRETGSGIFNFLTLVAQGIFRQVVFDGKLKLPAKGFEIKKIFAPPASSRLCVINSDSPKARARRGRAANLCPLRFRQSDASPEHRRGAD